MRAASAAYATKHSERVQIEDDGDVGVGESALFGATVPWPDSPDARGSLAPIYARGGREGKESAGLLRAGSSGRVCRRYFISATFEK